MVSLCNGQFGASKSPGKQGRRNPSTETRKGNKLGREPPHFLQAALGLGRNRNAKEHSQIRFSPSGPVCKGGGSQHSQGEGTVHLPHPPPLCPSASPKPPSDCLVPAGSFSGGRSTPDPHNHCSLCLEQCTPHLAQPKRSLPLGGLPELPQPSQTPFSTPPPTP